MTCQRCQNADHRGRERFYPSTAPWYTVTTRATGYAETVCWLCAAEALQLDPDQKQLEVTRCQQN